MLDYLAALRGLTIRGLCFVATGLACCALAVVFGEEDLFRIGLLLLALPMFAVAFVCRTRYRLASTRRLAPARTTVGGLVSVGVRIENIGRHSSSVLLADDAVPERLGNRARFVLDQVDVDGARYLTYQLRVPLRGRYLIGPMAIRITDPFGLCELTRTFRSRNELVATPRVENLSRSGWGWRAPIGNPRRLHAAPVGTDDFSTRQYQPGDDLRQVHWRTSARAGKLMVRHEEIRRPRAAVVLLDTRSQAWVGQGPTSSFEWAVSAAGSIAVHLAATGEAVRIVGDNGRTTTAVAQSRNPAALLEKLATVDTADTAGQVGVRDGRAGGTYLRDLDVSGDGTLVTVLGATEPARAKILAAARPQSGDALAVLVDVSTWSSSPSGQRNDDLDKLEECRAAFRRQGWKVIVAGYGDNLSELWSMDGSATPGARRLEAKPISEPGTSASGGEPGVDSVPSPRRERPQESARTPNPANAQNPGRAPKPDISPAARSQEYR